MRFRRRHYEPVQQNRSWRCKCAGAVRGRCARPGAIRERQFWMDGFGWSWFCFLLQSLTLYQWLLEDALGGSDSALPDKLRLAPEGPAVIDGVANGPRFKG